MRTIKLQMQLTLDGFVAGPNGEMDWVNMNWDTALMQHVAALTDTVDTILLGHKLAEGFIPHWQSAAANPEDPSHAFAHEMTNRPRMVFSRTLSASPWDNATILPEANAATIAGLKQQEGKDIIVYGGGQLVSSLIQQNLIDEYHLFINPTAIGKGMPIFAGLEQYLNLKLHQATAFDCGIVAMEYHKV